MRELVFLFLKLGCIGFGGPQAHIALMEEECVRRHHWLAQERFAEGLALCNLLPGPSSTQLAIWLGYERRGLLGGIFAGLVFILPSFLLVVGLALLYTRYGTVIWAQDFLYGVHPAVIAIILATCYRLMLPNVREWPAWLLFTVAAALSLLFPTSVFWILIGAGIFGLLQKGLLPSKNLAKIHLWLLFLFFFKTGTLIFGGGLVIIPFIQGEIVQRLGWLTTRQFSDAVAAGQVTPGPVVMTAAFVGYLVGGGLPGACVAALGIFLPSFLLVLFAAPWLRRIKDNPLMKAFVKGAAPAVVGTIAAATISLGRAAWQPSLPWNGVSIALLLVSLGLLTRVKAHPGALVLGCGAVGVMLHAFR